jgi:hypothetical protein
MRCRDVQPLLVAHADHELSRSGHALVAEHIATCRSCHGLAERLGRATPEDALVIPPEIRARLVDQVTHTHLRDLAYAPSRPPPAWARRGWLDQPLSLSREMLLGYAVLLAAVFGWGLSGHMDTLAHSGATVSADPLPIGQYRPASWTPPRRPVDTDSTIPKP